MPKTADPQPIYRLTGDTPLVRAANLFLLDCEARNFTSATLRFYWQRLTYIIAYLAPLAAAPSAITPTMLRAYILSFRERELSVYYQHQAARVLRAWCNFLVREEILSVSPMKTVRMPKLPKEILPPFTPSDVKGLLAACDCDRDRAIILTLLDTGLRASELLALNWADVDLTTGAIRVRHGKGQKERIVFVGPQTRKALLKQPPASATEPLFTTLTANERLTFYGLQSLLRRLGHRAAVHPMGAHRFRRTFAIASLRAGMPLPQLAALMGHEGLTVLRSYLALVDDDLRIAHRQYGAVEHLLNPSSAANSATNCPTSAAAPSSQTRPSPRAAPASR